MISFNTDQNVSFSGASNPQTSHLQSSPPQPDFRDSPSLIIRETAIASVWLVVLLVGWISVRRAARNLAATAASLAEKEGIAAGQSEVSIPCMNCRYFSENTFLFCAVNPTFALTPDAKNCRDFCLKDASS